MAAVAELGASGKNTIMMLRHAILLTLGLFGLEMALIMSGYFWAGYSVILGSTLWASIDASRIQLKRYRSGVGPFVFFILCLGFWIVGFPWYLWMRHRIQAGTAELKTSDLRCVSCEELIAQEVAVCPKCGWPQPKSGPVS